MAKLTAETNGAVPHDSVKVKDISTTQKLSELLRHGHAFTKALGGTLVGLGKHMGGNGISHAAETGKHAANMVSDLAHNRERLTRAGWIGAKIGKAGGLLLLAESPLALALMACEAYEEGKEVVKAVKTHLHPSGSASNNNNLPYIDFYQELKPGEPETAIKFDLIPTPRPTESLRISFHKRVIRERGGKKHPPRGHIRIA